MAVSPDISPERLVRAVHDALASIREVHHAYVFGSHVAGGSTSASDLDVAVKLDDRLDDDRRGQLKLQIIAALTDALGSLGERSDIVDLDRSSSAVAFRAIRDGLLALCRNDRDRVRLEASIARRYDDEAHHRALFRRAARMAARRMGGS